MKFSKKDNLITFATRITLFKNLILFLRDFWCNISVAQKKDT